jgi:hypothetical protein
MEKHLRGQILIQYVNQQMMVRKFSIALEHILAPPINYVYTLHYFSTSHLWSCLTVSPSPIQHLFFCAEEEISLEEEEAYEIWQNIPDEERTSHLDVIPNPDGVMIRPSHHHVDSIMDSSIKHKQTNTALTSPCELQMKRDPSLLNFDNVSRVDIAEIHTISSWDNPVIITNAVVPETVPKTILDKEELKALYGNVKVRTGNRETLIDNGFMNSIPKRLADALEETNNTSNTECGTIVFSPIQELPDTFIDELRELMDAFPSCTNSDISIGRKKKFTLTIASEGFGIGMHKHNAAMFMLLVGRKKWYMTDSANLDGIVSECETHPRFYRELSSHKCIQQAGEVLYVPNGWYHEIFNLEYTLGIQALPE